MSAMWIVLSVVTQGVWPDETDVVCALEARCDAFCLRAQQAEREVGHLGFGGNRRHDERLVAVRARVVLRRENASEMDKKEREEYRQVEAR